MMLHNINIQCIEKPNFNKIQPKELSHLTRFLLLYGSNREKSYSRFAVQEAEKILKYFGGDVKIFHPKNLPLPEDTSFEHPKVQEFYKLLTWSESMVWCSPERHGSMSSFFKAQIDWIPLTAGALRSSTQEKHLH